jgi:hypothetical protein
MKREKRKYTRNARQQRESSSSKIKTMYRVKTEEENKQREELGVRILP